jgi:hypothetical protein
MPLHNILACPLPPSLLPARQERFKHLERELKIKQFSSEGLSRDSVDPLMVAKARRRAALLAGGWWLLTALRRQTCLGSMRRPPIFKELLFNPIHMCCCRSRLQTG